MNTENKNGNSTNTSQKPITTETKNPIKMKVVYESYHGDGITSTTKTEPSKNGGKK